MKKYLVRFHLASGANHRKWQVKFGKQVQYLDPDKVNIVMKGCKLKNHKTVAQQIYEGANKTVCAWIECQSVYVHPKNNLPSNIIKICYNPKLTPNWIEDQKDVDNKSYDWLYTHDRTIYKYKEE